MTKKTVFISHISEEAELAALLKRNIDEAFLKMVDVFVSSDGTSIAAGRNWLSTIDKALSEAVVELVLCSPASITRPWINFEAGAGWIKMIPVIPICHTGLQLSMLPMPFSVLHGAETSNIETFKSIYHVIAEQIDCEPPTGFFLELEGKIKKFEDAYYPRMKKLTTGSSAPHCSSSVTFTESYNQFVEKKRYLRRHDFSDLWYIWINTKLFRECKTVVCAVLEKSQQNAKSHGRKLYDLTVWSLLGAAELLVRFRAESSIALAIEEELLNALKPPIPFKPGLLDDSYVGHENSLLESTHLNPKGISMINVEGEMIPDTSNARRPATFKEGALLQPKPIPSEMRSIKVFIKLHFSEGLLPSNRDGVVTRLASFTDTVETYAISRQQHGGPDQVIIEARFPCGHFEELQELSTELEIELFQGLTKETYLAYDQLSLE